MTLMLIILVVKGTLQWVIARADCGSALLSSGRASEHLVAAAAAESSLVASLAVQLLTTTPQYTLYIFTPDSGRVNFCLL